MIKGHIEREGFKLRYIIEGEGTPVLVCASANYYQRVFSKELTKHVQMIYFDNRVFGGSTSKNFNPNDFQLDKIYEDIEALRKHLKLKKFIIIGHSGQAYMALEYAKKYPSYVSHVVMISMSPTYDNQAHLNAENYWHEIASSERKAALNNNIKKWPDEYIHQLPEPRNFIQDYIRNTPKIWFDAHCEKKALALWEEVDFNVPGFNYIWGELYPKLDISENINNFKTPVAVMVGKYDGIIDRPDSWKKAKEKFQHLNIYLFNKSGHTPPLEEPELFNKYFLAFIN